MGPAGLQPALNERMLAKRFYQFDIGYGSFAFAADVRASATAISAVIDKERLDSAILGPAAHYCQVVSIRTLGPKLISQVALRFLGARKNNQPAGVPIQSMHGPNAARFALNFLSEEGRQQVCQRRRQKSLTAIAELGRFSRVPHGRQPRRFFDDNHVNIDVANDGLGLRLFMFWQISRLQFKLLPALDPPARTRAQGTC